MICLSVKSRVPGLHIQRSCNKSSRGAVKVSSSSFTVSVGVICFVSVDKSIIRSCHIVINSSVHFLLVCFDRCFIGCSDSNFDVSDITFEAFVSVSVRCTNEIIGSACNCVCCVLICYIITVRCINIIIPEGCDQFAVLIIGIIAVSSHNNGHGVPFMNIINIIAVCAGSFDAVIIINKVRRIIASCIIA